MLRRLVGEMLSRRPPDTAEARSRDPDAPRRDPNPLEVFFRQRPHHLIHKWLHYFDAYHRHLARFRGRAPVVLEIGVNFGGSLQMWRDYFGPGATIVGVDNNPHCRAAQTEGTRVVIGDQSDPALLARLRAELPRIDVLIDDGSHRPADQIASFEALYPHLAEDGVYICEDIHTSYDTASGGGVGAAGSFVEFGKTLTDRLNAWHSAEPGKLAVDDFTRSTASITWYTGMLVIERAPRSAPADERRGEIISG